MNATKTMDMIDKLLFCSEIVGMNWIDKLGKWLNVSRLTVCSPSACLIARWITITRFTLTYTIPEFL